MPVGSTAVSLIGSTAVGGQHSCTALWGWHGEWSGEFVFVALVVATSRGGLDI